MVGLCLCAAISVFLWGYIDNYCLLFDWYVICVCVLWEGWRRGRHSLARYFSTGLHTVPEKEKKNHAHESMPEESNRGAVWRAWAFFSLSVLLWCLVFGNAFAQSSSNLGVLEWHRQSERDRRLRDQLEPERDVRPHVDVQPELALPDDEHPCFVIRDIALEDETGLFAEVLAAANPDTDPAVGRCLGAAGINVLMSRVQNAVIAQGYVTTRVLARPQDLSRGHLVLTLIPGRVRALRVSADSDARAELLNAIPVRPGDVLNLRDIEQGLENLKRLPSVEADIRIEPGEAPGESDLVVVWKQGLPLRFNLSVNDGGSRETGKLLATASLSVDHLLALNDLFYASFNHDLGGGERGRSGTRGHHLHYSVPYGHWLLALGSGENRYRQTVAGATQDYLYSGTSESYDIKLSRILYRDARQKLSAFLRGYLTKSSNYIDDTEVEVQRRRMAGWEAGMHNRIYFGQGTIDLSAAFRRGTGAFDALAAPEEDFDEGTARPKLWTAEASVRWPFEFLGANWRYDGSWRAQWNRTPLVPQDRFSIGGRYTVRGFDGESVLMAERGFLIRNDFSLPLGNSGQELYLGIDHGRVGGASADLLIGRALTGAVLGLRGGYQQLAWDVFVGTPLTQPEGFKTAGRAGGFNLNWGF